MFPCSLDEQADGRAKRRLQIPVLKGRGGREVLGSRGLRRWSHGPRSTCWDAMASAALLHKHLMEKAPGTQPFSSLLSPLPGLGSPSPGVEASGCPQQLASQTGPTRRPASQNLLHEALSPADASPRLWPERHPGQSSGHRCSHSLALDKLLGKITEPAFFNSPLSGEKRGPSLLWLRAPGCPPRGPGAGCRSMRPLSVRLAPVRRSL